MATIPEALAIAVQHHQNGRLQAAEQIYHRILAIDPNQPDALHLLGVIAGQTGKHDVAIEYIGRAIRLNGNVATYHNNLGNALRAQGKFDEAVASYRRALNLKPDYAEAHNNLGVALKEQGKLDEAVASYRRALNLKRDYAEAHNNLGNALWDQGKLDDAAIRYRRALKLKPDYAEAHNNLGLALNDLGKPDEAVACYHRALDLDPSYAEAYSNLGYVLRGQGKLAEAVACCRRGIELKPDCAEAHNNLGLALNKQGKLDEALASYRRAIELKPDFAQAHYHLGGELEERGNFQGAEDSFRAALRCDPRLALAHHKLAELLGGKLPDEDLAAQRQLLEERKLPNAQRLLLHFGLAQVMDARGEYAEAAAHLDQGNSLQLSELRMRGQEYDPKEYEYLVAQMIAACTPDFFERTLGFGLESELPVFVVGLPRSGTTLIEQILASHSQVFGAGEIKLAFETMAAVGGRGAESIEAESIENLRRLDRPTVLRLAAWHLEKLRALNPAAFRIVDKMPDNYFVLGLLAILFPRAKFIHCCRDLRDIAISCWMTRFVEVRWANDQQHMVSRFREYQRMMEHWRKVLPVPLLEVDYEETVADLEGVARKLVAWCGLAWEPRCLEFHQAKRPVATASAVQVRQPIFRTSVGRWKHYEHALGSLFDRLESVVARNGANR